MHCYYHCNRAKGCKESFRVKDAHNELIEVFKAMKPPVEVCDLFELILEDHYKTSKQSQFITDSSIFSRRRFSNPQTMG